MATPSHIWRCLEPAQAEDTTKDKPKIVVSIIIKTFFFFIFLSPIILVFKILDAACCKKFTQNFDLLENLDVTFDCKSERISYWFPGLLMHLWVPGGHFHQGISIPYQNVLRRCGGRYHTCRMMMWFYEYFMNIRDHWLLTIALLTHPL